MKTLLLISTLLFPLPSIAGKIALTFDDAPRLNGQEFSGVNRTKKLLDQLRSNNIQAVFFCNSINLDDSGIGRLKLYSDQGHIIANHSHSHLDLDKVEVSTFQDDIEKANEALKGYPTFLRWFRFPYLHEGKTIEKRNSIRNFLKAHSYINGYVTVDNYDWYMDQIFQSALAEKKEINYKKLGNLYVQILWEGIQFFDKLAVETLQRSPKHVLLLHENDLAALYVGNLVEYIQKEGWKIISPIEAYQDPIAATEPNTFLLDQGRIAAIAKEKGHPGPFWSKWEEESEIEKAFVDANVFK